MEARLAQLEELAGGLRQEHSFLERALLLTKEFLDRYKAQAQWLLETKALLSTPVEVKPELYQRRAQLAKYKVWNSSNVTFYGYLLNCLEAAISNFAFLLVQMTTNGKS